MTERHILRASMKIGALRKTIALSLGLEQLDVENLAFREEDAYEVTSASWHVSLHSVHVDLSYLRRGYRVSVPGVEHRAWPVTPRIRSI